MKIEESKVASAKQLCKIPIGSCFKLNDWYYIKTTSCISDGCYECVDLDSGCITSISENVDVYPVDAIIVINKVGA